ncbi:hypothetical protein PHLH7_19690 [Pseudomonas sp. Ost2]|nr:hypothetical protein PHLH7_19690 [Pseudomonas sp. Ost2]
MYSLLQPPALPEAFHTRIYAGEIFALALPAMQELVDVARGLLEETLYPHDPTLVHRHLDHARQAECFTRLQAQFHQHDGVRRCWRQVLDSLGLAASGITCDRLHLRFQPPSEPGRTAPGTARRRPLPFTAIPGARTSTPRPTGGPRSIPSAPGVPSRSIRSSGSGRWPTAAPTSICSRFSNAHTVTGAIRWMPIRPSRTCWSPSKAKLPYRW